MKITIVGVGYVGLVSGVCFANMGNDVICIDINKKKVEDLNKAISPIYEPGLQDLLKKNIAEKRIIFTTNKKIAYESSDIIFICVGTPQKVNGDANLTNVYNVAKDISKHINNYKIIVNKSTVPVKTSSKIKNIILNNAPNCKFDVVSNPEFLKEGNAIKDFQNPDRIIIGTDSKKAKSIMATLYNPLIRINKPLIFTSVVDSELIKYASNSMLATRISFMNELSHLCEAIGGDIKEVAKGVGLDSRIGTRFLQAGVGYGGSCFPKDVRALHHTMKKLGLNSNILMAVDYVNERQKESVVPKLKKYFSSLKDKTVCIWGVSFKPKTDDVREAPSLVIINQLLNENAKVNVFDPVALENVKNNFKNIYFAKNMYDALNNADVLIIVTEWDDFRSPDFEKIKSLMKTKVIFDGRNIYDKIYIEKLGFKYFGVGR